MNTKGGLVEFAERTKVAPAYIIRLIQTQSRIYKLEGGQKLRFNIESPGSSERLALLKTMLADFQANSQ
jgi:transcription-repair coupling factor (superfamily II helicase)